MKKCARFLSALLAAALLAGAVPAQAMEKSLWPDYYSIESEYTKVEQDVAFYYSMNDRVTTYESDGYYAIASGTPFTVTNLRDDAGYVFIYYVPYTMQEDSLLLWTDHLEEGGVQRDFKGEYVSYNDGWTNQYYINSDGGWSPMTEGTASVDSEAFYDPEFYVEQFSGLLLSAGESVTFTLPEDGTDTIYLLWVWYRNPETDDYVWQYSEFKYEDTAATEPAEPSSPTVAGFRDVYESDYYAEAVAWAKENSVTSGTGDGTTFSPDATVTRAQAVTFLWRAAGSPEPTASVSPFTDVTNPSAYYYDAVLWAAEMGITGGVGGGRFGLDATLAYDQILTFLCRASGESATGSDWSAAAVNWAAENGLTDGLTFTAGASCPRSDVVYCLWKQLSSGGVIQPVQPSGESQEETVAQGPTAEEVYNAIMALKSEYPEGMRWTNDNFYRSDATSQGGYGCEGFALICSDAAFGELPVSSRHSNFDAIRVGDLLRINNDTHTVVVLEKRDNSVVVTEGNFNSSIHWNREISRSSLEQGNFTVRSRYPAA